MKWDKDLQRLIRIHADNINIVYTVSFVAVGMSNSYEINGSTQFSHPTLFRTWLLFHVYDSRPYLSLRFPVPAEMYCCSTQYILSRCPTPNTSLIKSITQLTPKHKRKKIQSNATTKKNTCAFSTEWRLYTLKNIENTIQNKWQSARTTSAKWEWDMCLICNREKCNCQRFN